MLPKPPRMTIENDNANGLSHIHAPVVISIEVVIKIPDKAANVAEMPMVNM